MLKNLFNPYGFLNPTLIQKCFSANQITHVDKQVCGNGFTTGFLKLKPSENGVNIIIAPNKAVLIGKENAYKKGEFDVRIKFFYAESTDTNFDNADVLFFVIDSFLMMRKKLKAIKHKIEKVLIDEYHSTEIQSGFRFKLVDFISEVKNICSHSNTAITTVTATPNLFSHIDIKIKNSLVNPITINISKDRVNCLNRIKADLKNGKNVIVASNDARAIYSLRDYKNELDANFITGISLMRSLVQLCKIKQNDKSNLTILSSRGFEGFDIYYPDAKIYFLEDRSNEHETFYLSNVVQAISRNRNGVSYIEYNRLELSNARKNDFKDIDSDIRHFVNRTDLSTENKQKTEFKKYHPFVIFKQDSNGKFSVKENTTAINLHKEKLLFDRYGWENDFKEFLNDRHIKINYLNDTNNRTRTSIKKDSKVKNLLSNKDLIKSLDLFGNNYKIIVSDLHDKSKGAPNRDIRKAYLKSLETYLMCKNYDGDRVMSEREEIALNILSSELQFLSLVKEVTKAYNNRSIKKYGKYLSKPYRDKFESHSYNVVCMFILMYANKRISVPAKWIANRNYNLLTQIGVDEIKLIGDYFNVDVQEVDIRTCNPRILYAFSGLRLPINFYGKGKKNKRSINKLLNSFRYDKKQLSSKKKQKQNAKEYFKYYGFDVKVIEYLMSHFFEADFKGDLFNTLSFYEKKIISEVKTLCKNLDNDGIIRRHDSIIIFNNRSDVSFLNNYEFMNLKGWFDVQQDNVINLHNNANRVFEYCEEIDAPILSYLAL